MDSNAFVTTSKTKVVPKSFWFSWDFGQKKPWNRENAKGFLEPFF